MPKKIEKTCWTLRDKKTKKKLLDYWLFDSEAYVFTSKRAASFEAKSENAWSFYGCEVLPVKVKVTVEEVD